MSEEIREKETKVLFIGSLPREYTNEDFESLLSEYSGITKSFVITNRGCGLVFFETDEQANDCLALLQGVQVEGKAIVANFANRKIG